MASVKLWVPAIIDDEGSRVADVPVGVGWSRDFAATSDTGDSMLIIIAETDEATVQEHLDGNDVS